MQNLSAESISIARLLQNRYSYSAKAKASLHINLPSIIQIKATDFY